LVWHHHKKKEFDVPGTKQGFELIEKGADLEPLGGITGELIVGEESGEYGGNLSAVLEQPIPLQDATDGGLMIIVVFALFVGGEKKRGLREVRESEGVDWWLLGVEVPRQGCVKLRTSHHSYQTHRWCPQLFRVFLHFRFRLGSRIGIGNGI
jgi:hypothetical protein